MFLFFIYFLFFSFVFHLFTLSSSFIYWFLYRRRLKRPSHSPAAATVELLPRLIHRMIQIAMVDYRSGQERGNEKAINPRYILRKHKPFRSISHVDEVTNVQHSTTYWPICHTFWVSDQFAQTWQIDRPWGILLYHDYYFFETSAHCIFSD